LVENAPSESARAISYPEPARNGAAPVIRALVDGAQGVEITIYDSNGQVVHSARVDAPNAAVDGRAAFDYAWTGSIPSGVYYAVVTDSLGDKKVRAKTKITVVR
jgi:flagellar hook assembly protein FlgD